MTSKLYDALQLFLDFTHCVFLNFICCRIYFITFLSLYCNIFVVLHHTVPLKGRH